MSLEQDGVTIFSQNIYPWTRNNPTCCVRRLLSEIVPFFLAKSGPVHKLVLRKWFGGFLTYFVKQIDLDLLKIWGGGVWSISAIWEQFRNCSELFWKIHKNQHVNQLLPYLTLLHFWLPECTRKILPWLNEHSLCTSWKVHHLVQF